MSGCKVEGFVAEGGEEDESVECGRQNPRLSDEQGRKKTRIWKHGRLLERAETVAVQVEREERSLLGWRCLGLPWVLRCPQEAVLDWQLLQYR